MLPIATLGAALLLGFHSLGIIIVTLAAKMPLSELGFRRIKNVGEMGSKMILPLILLAIALGWGLLLMRPSGAVSNAITNGADGLTGLSALMTFVPASGVLGLCALFCTLSFLTILPSAAGSTLLSSQPVQNKFGPVPTEVTQ